MLPWRKCQINVRELSTHHPWSVLTLGLLAEVVFQYASHTLDLVVVPLLHALNLLRVELCKPDCLAVVWALAGDLLMSVYGLRGNQLHFVSYLEGEPLLCEIVFFGPLCEADLVFRVVFFGDVLEDRARLPQREVVVWIVDGGHATIGVDLQEIRLLDIRKLDILKVVWEREFLGDHAHFRRVGAVLAVDLDGLDGG